MNDTRVGVVGGPVGTIAQAVDDAGGTPLVDDPLSDPVCVIAAGESALYSLVPDVSVPVLPVETETPGLDPITREDLPQALSMLLDAVQHQSGTESSTRSQLKSTHSTTHIHTHPVVGIDRPDGRMHALMDVTLVTAEPARISEYTVMAGTERVMSVRADGIVVATPAGSHGYAHDAGGPYIAPETGVGAVIPIAPFSTTGNQRVLSLSDIRLTIERDEASVELLVDGRSAGTVPYSDTLCLEPVATIETIRFTNEDWKGSNGSTPPM